MAKRHPICFCMRYKNRWGVAQALPCCWNVNFLVCRDAFLVPFAASNCYAAANGFLRSLQLIDFTAAERRKPSRFSRGRSNGTRTEAFFHERGCRHCIGFPAAASAPQNANRLFRHIFAAEITGGTARAPER
ncbi:hypothetical protein [Faecalispora sporosphaeroides]|uniref:hypothetical protein n=1 Tax=Faecalispora sporosphaeroides TaxID=1549 RepID=UPI0012B594C2|nr:hypothetical protein [Faecalispora sporosphaeroides]